jgi:hypothetical protein
VRIFPPKIEIAEEEGFDRAKDIFNRADFGSGLANLVEAIEDPMVIALDGQWGSGKSIFIKMWAGLLRQRGHPVIYFDAFANDYIEDAFLAIAGEVISLSQKAKSAKTSAHKRFLKGATRAGRALLRSSAKIGVKAATLGVLDAADFEDLKAVADDIADDVSSKADNYIETLLSRHGVEQKNIESFRAALSELATHLSAKLQRSEEDDKPTYRPLIFIVDELDRCKPPFALDLLEKIKHVFSVAGVHFVLVTHLAQLESFVRLSYGTEIDAQTYLQKFYNLVVHLPGDGRYDHERISRKFMQYLQSHLSLDQQALGFVDHVVAARGLSPRSLEKILTYMSLAIAFTTRPGHRYFRPSAILAGLCVLKTIEPRLFQNAKSGLLTLAEAFEAFQIAKWPHNNEREWATKWWAYGLDNSLNLDNQEWQQFASAIRGEFHVDRNEIVRSVAVGVIDRMELPEDRS